MGWAVGWEGTILATSDGGATWEKQTSGTPEPLFAVHFVDAQTGWAVGWEGTILATSDGGATWEKQTSGTSRDLYGVHFVEVERGWIVGTEGTILATSDGGATWEKQTSGTSRDLYGVHFVEAERGWAVGEGVILKEDENTIKDIIEHLKGVQNPLQILKRLKAEGLEYTLRQNSIQQQIETMNIRYMELQQLLSELPDDTRNTPETSSSSRFEDFFGRPTIIRFGIMFFIAFLLQLLVSLYRYNMRLAAYYDARGDALFFAAAAQEEQKESAGLDALTEIFSPDSVDYGRSPNMATKQIIEVAKSLSQGMDTPKRT